jgi:hypothetical protein
MKKAINKISNYFSSNFEVLVATVIFLTVVIAGNDFYSAIILMLEFIVIKKIIKISRTYLSLNVSFLIKSEIIFTTSIITMNSSIRKNCR